MHLQLFPEWHQREPARRTYASIVPLLYPPANDHSVPFTGRDELLTKKCNAPSILCVEFQVVKSIISGLICSLNGGLRLLKMCISGMNGRSLMIYSDSTIPLVSLPAPRIFLSLSCI